MSGRTQPHTQKERLLLRHRILYLQTRSQVNLVHEGALWAPLLTQHQRVLSNSPISTSQVTETISPSRPTRQILHSGLAHSPTAIFVAGYSSLDVDGVTLQSPPLSPIPAQTYRTPHQLSPSSVTRTVSDAAKQR